MTWTITCRVCSVKCNSHDDGVLLCDACRADPNATRNHVNQALVLAERQHTTVEQRMEDDVQLFLRHGRVVIAQLKAGDDPAALAAFNAKRAAALAAGDDLSAILESEDALARTKAWWQAAIDELDALAE